MNIFALDDNPRIAAQQHLDKHVVKMIIEYAQLLSTAHRMLDGTPTTFTLPDGKKQVISLLEGETAHLRTKVDGGYMLLGTLENVPIKKTQKYQVTNPFCYSASHQNHPCAIWTRKSHENYNWLFQLFEECSHEYTHRYGKEHKTYVDLKHFLRDHPRNIPIGPRTPFPLAMGDEFKVPNDPIASYKNYYLGPKAAFARWTNRTTPDWFKTGTKDFNASHFERTRQLA